MVLSLVIVGLLFILVVILLIREKSFLFTIRVIGVYVWVSLTIMVIPYFIVFETSFYLFEAVLHTMRSMLLNNDSTIANYFANRDVPYALSYTVLLYIFYVLAPIFTLLFSISLFEKYLNKVIYWLFRSFKDSIVFSEYNHKTLYLGELLRDKYPHKLIVYLTDESSDIDYGLIKKMKALVFDGKVHTLKHSMRKNRSAYLLSDNELNNIKDGMAIVPKAKKKSFYHDMYLVYRGEAPKLMFKFIDVKDKLNVHWIEEERMVVEELLLKSPLYNALNNNTLNLMIVGLGNIGEELLKRVIYQSNVGLDTTVHITAIDLYATKVKQKILHGAPLAFESVDIEFLDLDVTSYSFDEALKKLKHIPTYIVIALTQQQMSIETAIFLRRFYAKIADDSTVKIHVAIDDTKTEDLLNNLKEADNSEELDPNNKVAERVLEFETFGIYKENYKRYIGEEIHNKVLCYLTNAIYNEYIKNDKDVETAIKDIKAMSKDKIAGMSNDLDIKKTRPFVIHLATKLNAIGYEMKFNKTLPEAGEIASTDKQLRDDIESNLKMLTALDGKLWQAFKKCEGYTPLDLEETAPNKYEIPITKEHARINLFDTQELAERVGKPKNFFIDRDQKSIRTIPDLIQLYNDKIKEFDKNAKYIVIAKKDK